MKARISKRSVEAIVPMAGRDVMLFDTEIRGFAVKVTPGGARVYLLQYQQGGRNRRVRIGRHGELTAEEARDRARRLRVQVADGLDPFVERQRDRAQPTVAELGERFMREHAAAHKRPSSAAEDRRNLTNHIKPLIGDLRTSAVMPEDVAKMIRAIAAGDTARDEKTEHGRRIVKGGEIVANRVRALLSTMMTMAEAWGYRAPGSNPCRVLRGAGVVRRYEERKRQRFLTGEELARLGEALQAAEATEPPGAIAALRLLLFTGCRLAEIRTLRWSYVDISRGLIDLPTSKTGAKTVFLSAPALHVLASLERPEGDAGAYVFPARRRRRRPGGVLDTAPRPIEDLRGPWERVRQAAGLASVRMHDLRHTFASVGAAGGLSLQLIGGLLGHSSTTVTERYAHLVDTAQRNAVERIGADLAAAMTGRPGKKVKRPKRTGAKVAFGSPAA